MMKSQRRILVSFQNPSPRKIRTHEGIRGFPAACENGHLFCKTCAINNASHCIGEQKYVRSTFLRPKISLSVSDDVNDFAGSQIVWLDVERRSIQRSTQNGYPRNRGRRWRSCKRRKNSKWLSKVSRDSRSARTSSRLLFSLLCLVLVTDGL